MKNIISDKVGKDTLEIVGEAEHFNRWMFETILPFSKGKVLEIGSGIGNISKFFLNNGFQITLTDLREEYCLFLKEKFHSSVNLLGIEQMDLTHPEFERVYSDHLKQYDTVFALNVIEHIEDDTTAIFNCKKLLRDNGRLIILVPSYKKLYNSFDKELGHFRRYNQESLSKLFTKNGFKIIHQQYFNCMGILGWYFSGSLLKKENIPSGQMKIYNKLVPLWKTLDLMVQNRIGLSTIAVGVKS